jgi:hypothetical protein
MGTSHDINKTQEIERAGGKERRSNQRHHCEGFAEASVSNPQVLFRGEVRDISRTGCYIKTYARLHLALFTTVDIHFKVNGKYYHAPARVMNIRPGKGVGLEFVFPDPQAAEWLSELLEALNVEATPTPELA